MEKVEVYEIVINDHDESGVDYTALVDQAAIMKNFMAFNKQHRIEFKASDDDKQIILGAAMIPDLKIYRNSPERGDFYVYFTKDTIRKINNKMHRNGFGRNINLMHNKEQTLNDVYIVFTFITDSKMGITDPKGFDNPEGTLYFGMHINNVELWNEYKEHGTINGVEINGFSVEGLFDQVLVEETKEDKILKEIKSIIKSEFKA